MKQFVSLLVFFLVSTFLFAQIETFHLEKKWCRAFSSPFGTVNIIDFRENPDFFGFVQSGPLNRLAALKFKGSFKDSLAAFFRSRDSLKSEEVLSIIINEFSFGEKTESMSEKGLLRINMRFFKKSALDRYHEILNLDTVYVYRAIDVTNKLLGSVSENLYWLAKSLSVANSKAYLDTTGFTLRELNTIDLLEKKSLPVYVDSAKMGIFKDYNSFKMNSPELAEILIDSADPNFLRVYKVEKNGKKISKERINNEEVYAVCDGKTLVKATTFGFYPLKKINTDFYFNGQTAMLHYIDNSAALWGAAFGVLGYAMASANSDKNIQRFKFKINYLNGNSMPVNRFGN